LNDFGTALHLFPLAVRTRQSSHRGAGRGGAESRAA
jgi:hypothetical protein